MIVTPVCKKTEIDPLNFSIPGKVFSHILLQRIKQQTEELIEENRYGFCPNRGTASDVASLGWVGGGQGGYAFPSPTTLISKPKKVQQF